MGLKQAIELFLVMTGLGIWGFLWLWGGSKIIRAATLARRIEKDLLDQIKDMVKQNEG